MRAQEQIAQNPSATNECIDIDEFFVLRNEFVGLHNLADVVPFGYFDAYHDHTGSHFVKKTSRNRVSPFELDITLAVDDTSQSLAIVTHRYTVNDFDGLFQHSIRYELLLATHQIRVGSSAQRFTDGLRGTRPVGLNMQGGVDRPIDSQHLQDLKGILEAVYEQQGHVSTSPLPGRFIAWLMAK